jgi:peptidyl-prolyl cis-trans isomerase C
MGVERVRSRERSLAARPPALPAEQAAGSRVIHWENTETKMKVLAISLFIAFSFACAQTPAPPKAPAELPDLPDSAVIAEFGDQTKFTMGDFRKYVAAMPPETQALALADPQTWIEGFAHMKQMADLAEKDKLYEHSPLKEQLELQRLYALANAEGADKLLNILVEGPEITRQYDLVKDKYKQVKVSAIYIAFGQPGLKEDQAKAKAEKLLAQIRKGADFAKLARENSDDETSKAKDGFFATLTPSDNIPDALRTAVFKLKEGETSEPVRQPNGFYLLRAGQVSYKPLAEVRDQIFNDMKNQRFQDWLNKMAKEATPKFPNPAFPVKK